MYALSRSTNTRISDSFPLGDFACLCLIIYIWSVLPFPGTEANHTRFFRDLSKLARHWRLAQPEDADFFDEGLIHHRSGAGDGGGEVLYEALISTGETNLANLLATH